LYILFNILIELNEFAYFSFTKRAGLKRFKKNREMRENIKRAITDNNSKLKYYSRIVSSPSTLDVAIRDPFESLLVPGRVGSQSEASLGVLTDSMIEWFPSTGSLVCLFHYFAL